MLPCLKSSALHPLNSSPCAAWSFRPAHALLAKPSASHWRRHYQYRPLNVVEGRQVDCFSFKPLQREWDLPRYPVQKMPFPWPLTEETVTKPEEEVMCSLGLEYIHRTRRMGNDTADKPTHGYNKKCLQDLTSCLMVWIPFGFSGTFWDDCIVPIPVSSKVSNQILPAASAYPSQFSEVSQFICWPTWDAIGVLTNTAWNQKRLLLSQVFLSRVLLLQVCYSIAPVINRL